MRSAATFSRRAALGLLAGVLVAACTTSDGPVDPVWGKEPCAHCKMLVSDKRYAAQVTAGGERHFFDDIGCMVLWLDAHEKSAGPARSWVRDAESTGWLDTRAARYASVAHTPMDFGFEGRTAGGIAFDDMREAVAAKKRSAR